MSRRPLYLLIPLLTVAVAACEVRTHLFVDAADLSAGTVTAVVGFDREFRELIGQAGGREDALGEIESAAAAEGWRTEPFVDGDIEGYRVSHAFSSVEELEELISDGMLSAEWGYTDLSFSEEDGEFVFEASGGNPMSEFSGDEGFEQMDELLTIDFQIAVTFPGPVKEHNGVLVDRTVTWDLNSLEASEGRLLGRSAIGAGFPWAFAGGLALALVVLGAVVWRLRAGSHPSGGLPLEEQLADTQTASEST